jgi:hypothetical protein
MQQADEMMHSIHPPVCISVDFAFCLCYSDYERREDAPPM